MEGTYIVLAHYDEKGRGSVILGHFQTYEESLKCLDELHEYKNVLGMYVFSGGSVYTVPEKPYPKDHFLLAGIPSNYSPRKPRRWRNE